MKRKTEHFTYELIRAKRRSMSLKVDLDGMITVRAPYRMPVQTADWFVEGHRDWLEARLKAGDGSWQSGLLIRKRNERKEEGGQRKS